MTDKKKTVAANNQAPAATETEREISVLSIIDRMASNPNVDVDKLERMLDMQERMMGKQAEIDFNEAMAKLQPELKPIYKTAKAHNSTYATYDAIDREIRPFYTKHGFSISYNSKRDGETITYYGTLSHIGGHSRTAEIDLPADVSGGKNAIQAKASTITYAKRYLLTMLLNIVTTDEDDDGNAGGAKLISEEQERHLESLIEESKAVRADYLKHLGVEELSMLPAKDFNKAKVALLSKVLINQKKANSK